jgi:hypothetical protein
MVLQICAQHFARRIFVLLVKWSFALPWPQYILKITPPLLLHTCSCLELSAAAQLYQFPIFRRVIPVVVVVSHTGRFLCSCNVFGNYHTSSLYLQHHELLWANKILNEMPLQPIFWCEMSTFFSVSTATYLHLLLWRCTLTMVCKLSFCIGYLLLSLTLSLLKPLFCFLPWTEANNGPSRMPWSKIAGLL